MSRYNFTPMAEVVPEGTSGVARVRHIEVREADSALTSLRALSNPDAYVPEGRYAQLIVEGTLMMSDTSMEQRSNMEVVRRANGHVFIAGLGLGMILHPILAKPEVTRVTVVEKYADVIKLIGPTLPHPEKVELIEADVFDWKPPRGTRYDVVYFDIWPYISTDNLEEMATLHRRFAHYKQPGGWMESWMRGTLKYRKARDDRERARFRRWMA